MVVAAGIAPGYLLVAGVERAASLAVAKSVKTGTAGPDAERLSARSADQIAFIRKSRSLWWKIVRHSKHQPPSSLSIAFEPCLRAIDRRNSDCGVISRYFSVGALTCGVSHICPFRRAQNEMRQSVKGATSLRRNVAEKSVPRAARTSDIAVVVGGQVRFAWCALGCTEGGVHDTELSPSVDMGRASPPPDHPSDEQQLPVQPADLRPQRSQSQSRRAFAVL